MSICLSQSFVRLASTVVLTTWAIITMGEPVRCTLPIPSDTRTGQKTVPYSPNQICPPIPKFEYTDEGRAIMIKRYPYIQDRQIFQFKRYRYMENKRGVEHFQKGCKLKREPEDILSSDQKAILKEWGQPDYLRGPYDSTRHENVTEWVYHPLNHVFQFIGGTMVYEGPLTDQERTALAYGVPTDYLVTVQEPNIRRETWIYRTSRGRGMLFSFANGKLIYENAAY